MGFRNLPVQATGFLGRIDERREISALLLADGVRLVTLTGPGGTGKTRLAVEVASRSADSFPGGIAFVSLAPIRDPALVLDAVAEALDIREEGARPAIDMVGDFLRSRRALLVLDNFEQVMDAAVELAELLRRTSALKLLITSRAPLRIVAEREVPVDPLPVPMPDASSCAEIGRFDSVRLFVERARAIRPDFALTDRNAGAVAGICARLDGLPLPIELVAGRVRVFSPQMMLERLRSRLGFLCEGPRDAPARHRTLREMIAWSHGLLSTAERILFSRLSVFASGATLEAIESICEMPDDRTLGVPATIDRLLEQNLARSEESHTGERRFSMLETVREFAVEELEKSGEHEALRRRHADYYLAAAKELEPRLRDGGREPWLRRLDAEHDNFRAAFDWVLREAPDVALDLAGSLYWFWYFRGHLREGRDRLVKALGAAGDDAPRALRAKGLQAFGFIAAYQGDYPAAISALEESVALWRSAGDLDRLAYALAHLSRALHGRAEWARAETSSSEAVELFRSIGDRWGLALALFLQGCSRYLATPGPPPASVEHAFEECERLYRDVGCSWGRSAVVYHRGQIAERRGEPETALALYEEALRLFRAFGERWRISITLGAVGRFALERGDLAAATAHYEESLAIAREIGNDHRVVLGLEGFAMIASNRGDDERAARLLGAVQAARARLHIPLSSTDAAAWERELAVVRARLGDERFGALWSVGLGLSLEEAVEERTAPVERASAVRSAEPSAPERFRDSNVFRAEGDFWTIKYGGATCRLKAARGMAYIAYLLRHPGQDLHPIELAGAAATRREAAMSVGVSRRAAPGLVSSGLGDAGEILDARAKAEYRRRLAELRTELDEARESNDPGRAARTEGEIDVLTAELTNAFGFGGRVRRASSAAERARVSLTKRIKEAIVRIERANAPLGSHLRSTIRTGSFFSYTPDPRFPIDWVL